MARDVVSFSVKLAEKVGFENAGFLQDIAYWLDYNKSSGINYVDGRYWSFSTQDELCDRHPYWTRKQVQRIIKNCRDNGWLLVGNFNKNPYDRTNWYSVSDEIMEIISGTPCSQSRNVECPERGNGNTQTVQCTEIQTGQSIKNINKERINKNNNQNFESFWQAYPKKKNKLQARKAFDKVKIPLQTLLDAIEKQKQSKQWQKNDGEFIPYPATWLNSGAWEDEVEPDKLTEKPKKSDDDYWAGFYHPTPEERAAPPWHGYKDIE